MLYSAAKNHKNRIQFVHDFVFPFGFGVYVKTSIVFKAFFQFCFVLVICEMALNSMAGA